MVSAGAAAVAPSGRNQHVRLRHLIAASFSVLALSGCGAIGAELSASSTTLSTPATTEAVDTRTVVAEPPSVAPPTSSAPAPDGQTATTGAEPTSTRAPKSITGCDYPYPNSTTYFSDGSTGWTRYCEQQMRQRVEADHQGGSDCVGTVCHPDGFVPPGMGGSTAEDKWPTTTPTETPEVSTPETTTPETSSPETTTPETTTPETSNPEISSPETSTPETTTPETSNPETSTPETSTPTSEAESAAEPLVETTPAEAKPPSERKPEVHDAQ
jgi:hypothetical protein